MVAGVEPLGARLVRPRPEHAAGLHRQAHRRQHVVDPEVAVARAELRGVVRRGRLVRAVDRIRLRRRDRSLAARRGETLHARMFEQLVDGAGQAAAVGRVGVVVADDHELLALGQAAAAAGVVAEPGFGARREVFGPEPDLVVVARGVAAFRAVEYRRRRVRGQQVDAAQRRVDRQIPVGF